MDEQQDCTAPRPVQLSMFNESAQISVQNSHLISAGGNVNPVSVSVTLNNPPPTQATWSAAWPILGQWLLGSQKICEPTHPISPPDHEHIPQDLLPKSMEQPSSPSYHLGPDQVDPDHAPQEPAQEIGIVPFERLDIRSELSRLAAPIRMPHEIYVSHLFPAGHGYPCANPKPLGEPIKIGDIGILDSDRLDVLQNLYTLPESFLNGSPVPEPITIHDRSVFEEGECIMGGVEGCDIKMNKDELTIEEISIRCHQDEGAVLAITSGADLLKLKNQAALHQYLNDNAGRLFSHLKQLGLPPGSSLYVVTGLVMSATWATAIQASPMHHSHNTLILKRFPGNQERKPFYMWKSRGNAHTRTQGMREEDTKDQCLFMRGFLLTASETFWKTPHGEVKVPTADQHAAVEPREERQGQRAPSSGRGNGLTDSQTAQTFNLESLDPSRSTFRVSSSISVQSFPPKTNHLSVYPSSRINKAILDLTDAQFAITHDDDWIEAIKRVGHAHSSLDEGLFRDWSHQELKPILLRHIHVNVNDVASFKFRLGLSEKNLDTPSPNATAPLSALRPSASVLPTYEHPLYDENQIPTAASQDRSCLVDVPTNDPSTTSWSPASVSPELELAGFRPFVRENSCDPEVEGPNGLVDCEASTSTRPRFSTSRKRSMLSRQYHLRDSEEIEQDDIALLDRSKNHEDQTVLQSDHEFDAASTKTSLEIPHPQPTAFQALPPSPIVRLSLKEQSWAPPGQPSGPSLRYAPKGRNKKLFSRWLGDDGSKRGKGWEKERGYISSSSLSGTRAKQDELTIDAIGQDIGQSLFSTSKLSENKTCAQPEFAHHFTQYPVHVERAIYRLGHIKLADPSRPLYEQVLISNLMFRYLDALPPGQPLAPKPQKEQQQSPLSTLSKPYPSNQQGSYPSPTLQHSYPNRHAFNPLGDSKAFKDFPDLVEEAQASTQHRSLPREGSTPYLAELSPLELALIRHFGVLHLLRSPLKDTFDLDEILEMIETKKSGLWKTLFEGNTRKKNVKKATFGVPLAYLVEREGLGLSVAAGTKMSVPSFVDKVISAIRTKDLSVEGIFRKNQNIRHLQVLAELLDRDPASVDLTQCSADQLAALLKKFLRDLPEPLMTFKLYRLFVASQTLPSEEDRQRYLHYTLLLLPEAHRDTLNVLLSFLKYVESSAYLDAKTGNEMDLINLATVIGPTILYPKGRGDLQRDETFGALKVIKSLLEHQDKLFLVPACFMQVLHEQDCFANALDLPSKTLMKTCATYIDKGCSTPRTPTKRTSEELGNNT